MGVVKILSPEVAEGIAAGEVIERPASVVKELVENSLDAGATEIAVILEEGGRALIGVEDNGSGMEPEDLKLSIARHATSKIQTLGDLEKLNSMGFRGEALASIAAATDLTILSRVANSATAYSMHPNDGLSKVTWGHFLGTQHGTRVEARQLFAQIPARLKFLKSPRAEVGYVREILERLALTHPQTGFKLVSDDRTVLDLRPAAERERVQQLLSSHAEHGHLEVFAHGPIRLYWLRGSSVGTLKHFYQVVNRRALRDRLLQQAVMSAFRQSLLPGQFPALVLCFDIDPAAIDVNSHPTKTEVRFTDSGYVFQAIRTAAEALINAQGRPLGREDNSRPTTFNETPQISEAFDFVPGAPSTPRSPGPKTSVTASAPTETPATPSQHPLGRAPYLTTLFRTYLAFDLGTKLALVDQHAADERVRYEKFKRELTRSKVASQGLLLPEKITIGEDGLEIYRPWESQLAALGFEIDPIGDTQLLVRAIPALWGNYALPDRLANLWSRVAVSEPTQNLAWDEVLFETTAMRACRSAVKAGDVLSAWGAHELVGQMLECEHPWNCPHGRPTTVEIEETKFEEWFLRTVPS